MISKNRIMLIVLIALFIISIAAATGYFFLYQNESAQNIKLQTQVADLEARLHQTANQLDESKKTAADLTLKLQEAKTRIDTLSGELAAEKSTNAESASKIAQLNDDLAKQKSMREDLENRLNQLQGDSKQIKEQIRVMEQQKAALEAKIKNLEAGASGVELGKVVVNPEAAPQAKGAAVTASNKKPADVKNNPPAAKVPPKVEKKEQPAAPKALEGKVMIVNKEFNFVVINLGSKDKVNVGDEFSVFHGNKLIGDLKVEKVHEFMSAAGFAGELKDSIKENDKVVQKTK